MLKKYRGSPLQKIYILINIPVFFLGKHIKNPTTNWRTDWKKHECRRQMFLHLLDCCLIRKLIYVSMKWQKDLRLSTKINSMKIIESGDKGGMMSDDTGKFYFTKKKNFQISILNYYIQYMALTKIGCLHFSKEDFYHIDSQIREQMHLGTYL